MTIERDTIDAVKLRGRIRASIKWTGAAATVLLLIVWVGSGWYQVTANTPTTFWHVNSGLFRFAWNHPRPATPTGYRWSGVIDYGVSNPPYKWWFSLERFPTNPIKTTTVIYIPIWFFALLTGLPTFLIWRGDRRRRLAETHNLCRKCGYSRTGLPATSGGVCPECGSPAKARIDEAPSP